MTISKTQSDFLNFARWFSAWLVVAEHTRSLMFRDFSQVTSQNVVSKLFYFVTGFGHEAVMIFFVISGYLVGGKVISRMFDGSFLWKSYLADRFSRLYAVLILALVVGFAFDYVGGNYINSFGLYDQSFEGQLPVVTRSFKDALGLPAFFGNLLFLQTILTPTYGSNGPLWSLAYEFWYYILFPAILGMFCQRKWLRIGCVLLSLVLFVFLPLVIKVLFCVWVIGALTSLFTKKVLPFWLSLLFALSCLFLARIEILTLPFVDKFLIGISFSLLLNSLLLRDIELPFRKVQEHLADFSFSTYLIHFPLLVILLSAGYQYFGVGLRMEFAIESLSMFVGVMVVVLLFCWLFAQVTEARTPVFRRLIYRIMGCSDQIR